VKEWVSTAEVRSTGPSGIGFVNFGEIDTIDLQAPVVTTGPGARGFNLYDGSLKSATFHSIRTTGDGSVGIQVSKPMGSLTVHHDVVTTGGEGTSLVKGVQVALKAVALSVKPGGDIRSVVIGGALRTEGPEVVTFEVADGGAIADLEIRGGVEATGAGSRPTDIQGHAPAVEGTSVTEG
jgi:hypothetical protein